MGVELERTATLTSASDRNPFGLAITERSTEDNSYCYGFNGKEDNRGLGENVIQDYGFRLYSPVMGRFLSVDPLARRFSAWTPYSMVNNNPINFTDPDGRAPDTTRVYDLEGVFVGQVNDNLPNEEHFFESPLPSSVLSGTSDQNALGAALREQSVAYVGANTRSQLRSQLEASNTDVSEAGLGPGLERGFLLALEPDCRELCVIDISDRIKNRTPNGGQFPSSSVINIYATTGGFDLFGEGHTHGLYSLKFGSTFTRSLREPTTVGGYPDYSQRIDIGRPYLGIIASPNGYTLYSTKFKVYSDGVNSESAPINFGQFYSYKGLLRDSDVRD